jgi:hypothetical protein
MNTKRRSSENKANILKAIHRFGWLRTRDIACLVWTKWKHQPSSAKFDILKPARPTSSQLRMAQRTVRALTVSGHLLVAKGPDGSTIYALSSKGAQAISTSFINASAGKDLIRAPSLGYFRHRCVSNEIAITAMIEGFRVSTEREIAGGNWKWGKSGLYGKTPDVLVKAQSHLYWIEVERSRKNQSDYKKLLVWLQELRSRKRVAQPLADASGLGLTVIFVCTQAFAKRLTSDLTRIGFTEAEISSLVEFRMDLYRFEVINFI